MMLLIASLCFSQSRTYVGVKGGYNFGSAFIKHSVNRLTINEGFKSGSHFGLTFVNYLQKNVGLQAELNYTQKGWTQKFNSGEKYVQNLDYLEFPLLVNVYVGNKKTRLFINFGMFIDYLLKSSNDGLPSNTEGSDFYYYQDERDRKFGYGLAAGGGFHRDFGFGTLLIEGRFSFNQSDAINPGSVDSGIPNVSNQFVTTISIGYLYRFGKGFE